MPRSMPLPAMPPASLSALLTYRAPRVFPLPPDPVLEGVVPQMESPGLARAEPRALPLAGQIASGSSGALAVVEAMKMENVLRAAADGVVAEILVEPGASLAVDDVIMAFE